MLHTYIYWIHIDAMIKDARIKDAGRKTQEDFFTNILPLTLLQGFERLACERMLETQRKLHILTPLLWPSRCVFIVLLMLGSTPSGLSEGPLGLVWPSLPHLVSTLWKSTGNCFGGFPSAPSVGCGLPYHISSLTLWESAGNCIGVFPSAPSVGCGRPYHIWSLLSGIRLATASGVSEVPLGRVWPSLPHLVSNPLGVCWQLHWDPNSTELNNNSTPTRSPTGSLKSNV